MEPLRLGPRARGAEARPGRGRRIVALAAGTAALGIAGWGVGMLGSGDAAEEHLAAYLQAWKAGDDRAAAQLTDRPEAALAALRASRKGLDGAVVDARVDRLDEHDEERVATLRIEWQVPRIGSFHHRTRVALRRRGGGWSIRWNPRNIHPALRRGLRLGTVRTAPTRGRILDRRERAIVTERPVVDVALRVDLVGDPRAAARTIAALVGVRTAPLERALRRAPSGRYVPVITLRKTDFDRIAGRLRDVRGISLAAGTAPLAPSRDFARALLGSVAPATAEQIERSDGRLALGDEVGRSGLQERFEPRLAGAPTSEIVIRRLVDGSIVRTLFARRGRPGRDLRTTLDLTAQAAAEEALGHTRSNAALVALEPSSGDVLAVANRPAKSSYDRARTGLYPPGSTFKVISTAALLRQGLTVDQTVACPATAIVDGRSFRNFEGGQRGAVPFSDDFAQSCNTAFVGLADRLPDGALTETARDYGIGRTLRLGLPAADGRVPPARTPVEQAASMIGQDRIVASPLIMAGVAATVAAGRWRAPRLVASDERRAGPTLPGGEAERLRELMRRVVEGGTGLALRALPGTPIGKSGTAEYGSGDPPPTHAWFVAERDDVAVAVLVEGGSSGGEVAAPIVARFFSMLDAAARGD